MRYKRTIFAVLLFRDTLFGTVILTAKKEI
jgi:hypothetical protein